MTFLGLKSLEGYGQLPAENGCTVLERKDLGACWTEILVQRLAMYRCPKATTVAWFGAAHFERWDDAYAFFVGLFAKGQLSGGHFVARRDP